MAAPTFFGAGAALSAIANTSVTLSMPASHQADDIFFLVVETVGNGIFPPTPAGWYPVPGSPVTDVGTTAGSRISVFWKRALSSAEGTVATGGLTDHVVARVYGFRGCITYGEPWDTYTSNAKAVASATATMDSITTSVADTLITYFISRPDDSLSTTHFGVPVNSNLTGLAEAGEAGTTSGGGGGFVVSYGTKATAGSTGTSTLTKSGTTTEAWLITALKPPQPFASSQTGFRVYEDGTETGGTVIAAQNTNITRTVNSNSNLGLRVLLQETGAGTSGSATDDYQLQYSRNSAAYTNVGGSEVLGYNSASLTDGGATTSRLVNTGFVRFSDDFNDNSTNNAMWAVFTSNGSVSETSNSLQITPTPSSTGNSGYRSNTTGDLIDGRCSVKVTQALNAQFGCQLRMSLSYNGASNTLEFLISNNGREIYCRANGTESSPLSYSATDDLYISIRESGGTLYYETSPDRVTWTTKYSIANPFSTIQTKNLQVVLEAGQWQGVASPGTAIFDDFKFEHIGAFVAGEVSEDGLVDDHQLTAGNYTEHLYSLTLVSSAVANNDTLDFRLLRNGSALTSYGITPRITVSKLTADTKGQFFQIM